jgi:MFS transporter, ACS family, D-galactonate transporter
MQAAVNKKRAWLIVAMLFFFMLVNFADKLVLGVTAPSLMRDMHISPSQYGYLASAFFIAFVASTIPVGLLSDRISNKLLLGIMAAIWSITQLPMIIPTTFGVLLASRVVLGAAEGPTTMSAQQAVYKWFPNNERTLPGSVMNQLGSSAGIFIAAPALTWITQRYSWHAAFGTLAVVGAIWCVAWIFVGKDGPIDASELRAGPTQAWTPLSYLRIVRKRTFLGALSCGFAAYWGITLLTTWGINFFVKGLQYTSAQAGWFVSIVAAAGALVGLGGGWVSQLMSIKGISSRKSRGLIVGGVTLISGICLVLMTQFQSPSVQIALFIAAFSVTSTVYTPCYAMIAEICPLSQRGGAFGIFTALMCCGGIIAPSVMGLAVEYGGGYQSGFMITGLMTVIAGIIGLIALNPERDREKSADLGAGITDVVSQPSTAIR